MPLMRASVIITAMLWSMLLVASRARGDSFLIPDGDVAALANAIHSANTNGEDDAIILAISGTYILTQVDNDTDGPNGLPAINSRITIEGRGATIKRSVIASTPEFRFFHVMPAGDLVINNLTLRNGRAPLWGGAILNNGGRLALLNSRVTENHSVVFGGGLANLGGPWELTNSSISENRAGVFGGGVFNFSGTLTMLATTVRNNQADFDGGGLYNNIDGVLQLTNSTISSNHAAEGGGGIYNLGGTVRLTSDTVAQNEALKSGGGILNLLGGSVTLSNSIIANQIGEADCAGEIINSLGHNLDSDGSCGLTAAGDLSNTDPMLGPLKTNGGSTFTHAPLFGSPVIDAGDASACLPEDQRGLLRPFEGSSHTSPFCDIGAVEFVDCNGDHTDDTTILDTDGDGTPNCLEACPDDPNKTDAGTCGCGVEDRDTDGDGVLDCLEGCPNDPNKLDPGICGCGQPDNLFDSDGDGVIDCLDNCPFIANTNQLDINNNGIGDLCESGPAGQSAGPCGAGAGVMVTPLTCLGLGWVRRRRRRR